MVLGLLIYYWLVCATAVGVGVGVDDFYDVILSVALGGFVVPARVINLVLKVESECPCCGARRR